MNAAKGVYFRREDYASFGVRVLVDVVDFIVFGVLCLLLNFPIVALFPWTRPVFNATVLVSAAAAFAYFVVLKQSRFRTPGYRLGRVKIVGADGRAPGYRPMSLRLMFAWLGPLNLGVDLLWLPGDAHRQALRDKFAGTYVVRADAQPVGDARVLLRYYEIIGYHCLFREIEPCDQPAEAAAPSA